MRGVKQKELFEISDLRRREILHIKSVCLFSPRGEGVTLIFSYIRRLTLFFCSKFLISIFLGSLRKLNIFGALKIL